MRPEQVNARACCLGTRWPGHLGGPSVATGCSSWQLETLCFIPGVGASLLNYWWSWIHSKKQN